MSVIVGPGRMSENTNEVGGAERKGGRIRCQRVWDLPVMIDGRWRRAKAALGPQTVTDGPQMTVTKLMGGPGGTQGEALWQSRLHTITA